MNEWENACLSSDFFCSLCLFGWHHQVPLELQWIYARILHLNTFWDLFAEIDFIFLVLNMSPSFGLSPTNLPSDPPGKRNWWNLPEVCVNFKNLLFVMEVFVWHDDAFTHMNEDHDKKSWVGQKVHLKI